MRLIPYGHQDISAADIKAVEEVLHSDWLTQGPAVPRFEQALIDYCRVPYAVVVANATAALHLACLALGVKKGDEVWTTPNTFVASANCALYCGAHVEFIDIDPNTYNMCPQQLALKLQQAEKLGKLPKVVIPVHFSGLPCDMQAINQLAKKYNFAVIEDASHAIGGHYLHAAEPVGNGLYSDITVFSFHPVKIITTAEGGAALTRNKELYECLQRLRTHGITRDGSFLQNKEEGAWYYEQIELGYNYRMTDMQAALGASQMQRLNEFISQRRRLVERYNVELKNLPIQLPVAEHLNKSAWHLYVIQLKQEKLKKNRKQIFTELRAAGIGVNVHYIPVYKHPYYQALGYKSGICPIAEHYYEHAITLPMYSNLQIAEQDYVIDTLRKVLL